ncbi:MAG: ATP-binding protein, partial [Exiguobacterium mexicanum]
SGKHFWKEFFLNFLNQFRDYPHIALVFTIRSNFIKSILPEKIESEFPLTKIEHLGLSLSSIEDLIPLFDFYNINLVDFPSFELESRNPLFLHTYCELLIEQDQYRGWSIFELLKRHIIKINKKLATDMRFRYLPEINLIDKILKAIAFSFLNNKTKEIALSDLYDIINAVASKYTDNYRELVNGLVEENILTVSTDYTSNEIAYFTYERFADLYIAISLVSDEPLCVDVIKDVNDENYLFYSGVLEGLSIVLPEKKNREIFDLFSENEITAEIAEAFVMGLSWRSQSSLTLNTTAWIEKCLNQGSLWLSDIVYIQLLKQSYLAESKLNSLLLHKHLDSLTLQERDSFWTQIINNFPEVVQEYINLALQDSLSGKHLKYDNYKLMSLVYVWLMSSTNRELRDSSTHALVKVFLKYPELLTITFKKFEKVNDPYIMERLLASAYGACLRIRDKERIKSFSKLIFEVFFSVEEVYSNILVRDYARGIILAAYEGESIDESIQQKITPPYKSTWYDSTYTLEEIDEKVREFKKLSRGRKTGFETIVRSLTTEYGRGTAMYGDFGRYVFGSSLKYWDIQFNDQDLSNIIAMRIIDYGYNEESHGNYDSNISSFDRHQNSIERIGKKYQWIAMYELLAKLCDNFQMNRNYNEEFDSIHFHGPWTPFIRDIDPSLLFHYPKQDKRINKNILPEEPDQDWVKNSVEVDNIHQFLEYYYEGEQFISLGQMMSQRVRGEYSESGTNEFFVKSKAVFVPTHQKAEYISAKIKNKDNLSVDWANSYSVFAFEHYRYPASEDAYYQSAYRDFEVQDALWEFTWENNINYETHERMTISILFPGKDIVTYYNLTQTSEGVWITEEGEMVALDTKTFGYEQNLIIRKDLLDNYLKEEKLSLVWDFYVEKRTKNNRKDEWLICWDMGKRIDYEILDNYSEYQ